MSLPFNILQEDVNLRDVLNLLKDEIFASLFSHGIATIESFNSNNQTATATMNYKKTYFVYKENTNILEPKNQDYPLLLDCPVIFLGGGESSLTFPVKKGDECLVLFNDRDIDNWFSSGQVVELNSSRMHSFSDAILIVGVRSLKNKLENFDTTRAVLKNGAAYVGVGPEKIKVANASYTLNTLLQELITEVKDLVQACANITVSGVQAGAAISGTPVNAATITAISSQLTTTANKIGGLLE